MAKTSGATTLSRSPRGVVVWFTGLSGAGKTTVADAVASDLRADGQSVVVLDGDVIRAQLSKDLGFSREDRDANVARIAQLARDHAETSAFVLVAVVSPYQNARDAARVAIGAFVEVHVATPLVTCIARDVKGLYKKALAGEIDRFTGVSDPYEPPQTPELTLDTTTIDITTAAKRVRGALVALGWLDDRPRGSSTMRNADADADADAETET
jgi:adenylylsulfate kinase